MKQNYIKPTTSTYLLHLSHKMLTTSIQVQSSSFDSSTGEIQSRRDNSVWDDEE